MKRRDWFILGGVVIALLAYADYQDRQNRAARQQALNWMQANTPRRGIFDWYPYRPDAPARAPLTIPPLTTRTDWYGQYRTESAIRDQTNQIRNAIRENRGW